MATNDPWDAQTAATATTNTAAPGLINAPSLVNNTSTATAQNSTATGYTPAQTALNTKTDTVQGQLDTLLSSDSPLMQRAQTKALSSMNGRGLINSSMAVGAAQGAMIDAATPIATADANTYATVNRENTGFANTANQFGAAANNQSSLTNAQLNTNTSLANSDAQNKTNQFNASVAQDTNTKNAANTQQANIANADFSNKTSQFNASASNDLTKLNMDIESKQSLGNIEAGYKTLMQANQSASEIYKQSVKNISDILVNKDLPQAAKDAAVANQVSMLKKGMEITGAMGSLDLGSLLDFGAVPNGAPA